MDWNGGVVKPPSFEDEGALHVGKGRFLLFMSGEQSQGVSSRVKKILVAAVVVIVAVTIILTTVLIGHQRNSIPYREQLGQLFGCTLETVSAELKLPVSNWTAEGENVYKLNAPLKVSGISYDLFLQFDSNAKMSGFEYIAAYKVDSKRAASDIYKARIDLGIQGHNPIGADDDELTASALRKYFSKGNALDENRTFRRMAHLEDPVWEYISVLEADPDWPGVLHGYVVKHAEIYEDVHVGYTPETESVLIIISRKVEPKRMKN